MPADLMRDLRAVVLVLPSAVHHGPHDGTVARRVTAQLVRDETARRSALSFQHLAKEAHRGSAVAARLDQDVEEVAVLVDGPPQILSSAVDRYEELIEIPGVAQPASSAPQHPGVVEPERLTSVADGFDETVQPR